MLTKLSKTVVGRRKRLGRGYGSGKGGHTSGRGQKGQKARYGIGILFEGVKMKKSFIKRLPLRRGKGKFVAKSKPLVIKLGYLEKLPSGSRVNLETLVKSGILKPSGYKESDVKILGGGKLSKKLIVELPISNSARSIIEKLGGKIEKESDKRTVKSDKEISSKKSKNK